jgi:4-hydroxy-3-polyprenylbenzoate decarboxylase
MLIDATQKHPMPPLALPGKEVMEHAKKLWVELKLPALSPNAAKGPWHGYTLGDWSETWERFAKRAVVGEWEANGLETIQRRREDVAPETPTAKYEKL